MAQTTVDRLESAEFRARHQMRLSSAPLCVAVVANRILPDRGCCRPGAIGVS